MKHLSLLTLVAAGLCIQGCGSAEASPTEEKDLRTRLTKPGLDYDSVPPANRAMVLGQMRAHGSAKKADELEKKWGLSK